MLNGILLLKDIGFADEEMFNANIDGKTWEFRRDILTFNFSAVHAEFLVENITLYFFVSSRKKLAIVHISCIIKKEYFKGRG